MGTILNRIPGQKKLMRKVAQVGWEFLKSKLLKNRIANNFTKGRPDGYTKSLVKKTLQRIEKEARSEYTQVTYNFRFGDQKSETSEGAVCRRLKIKNRYICCSLKKAKY